MLPSTPRTGRSRSVVRQPTTVSQPRSASVSRPRERYPVDDSDTRSESGHAQGGGGYARSVRSQRSVGNMRPSRTKESALPPLPPPPYPKLDYGSRSLRSSPSAYRRPSIEDSDSSAASTVSSSGSSFLERMKHRAYDSSSSQSSFELDPGDSKEIRGVTKSQKPGLFPDEQISPASDLASYGYSIWNRVATAASAWGWTGNNTTNITGVEPSSGDSEVTRVLKAYYISKARDRSDLPDWLFSERERGLTSERPTHQPSRFSDEQIRSDDEVARARGRGLRDVYENAAASTSTYVSRPRERGGEYGQSALGSDAPVRTGTASKATDRLKAIRDAKRQAARAGHATEPVVRKAMSDTGDGGYDRRRYDYEDSLSSRRGRREISREPVQRIPASRVGLPTNPRRH